MERVLKYLLAHVSLLHRLIRHESKVDVREMGPLEARKTNIFIYIQISKFDPTKDVTLIWQQMKP